MDSIKNIFRFGRGPSSSHTMAPMRAARIFLEKNKDNLAGGEGSFRFEVELYGSLAATGKGHMTDVAILDVLQPVAPTDISWYPETNLPLHPNGMIFKLYASDGVLLSSWRAYSIGGGALADDAWDERRTVELYDMDRISEIQKWCNRTGYSYWEYVGKFEDSDIWDYLNEAWKRMQEAVERGINTEGVLPGGLGLRRKAGDYYIKAIGYNNAVRGRGLVYAYALAVSEENACGGEIVTAPTCGSSGVLPAVLYHLKQSRSFPDSKILHALATAGLFGNVVRVNASVSGAAVGCQGEVGVACAMAAAASSQLFGGTVSQIEYAAEMGLEHHLGLTCDPVGGLVQIPCIERNAFAAARALDANTYSNFSDGRHRVSFDQVVDVMQQTGNDLPSLYKETSQGGLAKKLF
ncbi:MAG: L-serine ammonia-lyase, iron-sulfur-dependent, subunit alpha [Bacteroidetes bacterium]|uniref:L-serine ammonia-lyase n=1 Tax=Candidatus Merdivivens pullistercoris TaxID=2840873 RepID=A0A9D9N8Y9_9BACT|nr:L-serine ammonia-lyase, iron-sulfur-dependent, subunit alpha [Candidatus Merdivivens pullistercoris]